MTTRGRRRGSPPDQEDAEAASDAEIEARMRSSAGETAGPDASAEGTSGPATGKPHRQARRPRKTDQQVPKDVGAAAIGDDVASDARVSAAPAAQTAPPRLDAAPADPDAISRAARLEALRQAGLATHLITLEGEDDPARLAPLLDQFEGPLFRVAPGAYAVKPCETAALVTWAAHLASVSPIPASHADGRAQPCPAPEFAYLGPLMRSAGRHSGPHLVVDADFAIAAADHAARGVAEAVAKASEGLSASGLVADRLAEIDSRLGRLQTSFGEAETSSRDAASTQAQAIEARIAEASAAMRRDLLEALEARQADQADAIFRRLEEALGVQGAALRDLTEAVTSLPRPNLHVEREGLRRLIVALETQLRGLDARVEEMGTDRREFQVALESVAERVEGGISSLTAELRPLTTLPQALRDAVTEVEVALEARLAKQEAEIHDLRRALVERPRPDLAREREGLHRTTVVLQGMLGALDAKLHAQNVATRDLPPPAISLGPADLAAFELRLTQRLEDQATSHAGRLEAAERSARQAGREAGEAAAQAVAADLQEARTSDARAMAAMREALAELLARTGFGGGNSVQ